MTFARLPLRVASAAVLASAVLLIAGCTAAPAPEPAPPPPSPQVNEPSPPRGVWDLELVRDFPEGDGVRTCRISMSVGEGASGTPEEIAAAREFLATGDWTTVEVSLDDFDPNELAARRAQGLGDASLLLMLVGDRISADLSAAGHLASGMTTESWSRCD